MTFYPEYGIRSTETFDTTGGAVFTNSALQSIVAGHVTLVSTITGTSYVTRNWAEVHSWSFESNLYNTQDVTGSFNLLTGKARANTYATQSGSQEIDPNGMTWHISTSYPRYYSNLTGYSGQISQALYLGELSPYSGYANSINEGASAFTIEFDIASTAAYSGLAGLQGYTTGQNNITGLSPLTGVIGHGVLIQTINKWDFIEVTPYGIRSRNHPELSIPINLTAPKRVRIGVRDSDLYLATEDGRSVYGLGKFNTVHSSAPVNPMILFGVPFYGLYITDKSDINVDGFYGETYWDNIKILTGDLVIHNHTMSRIYSTGIVSMYTAPFDPNISIDNYLNATIGYVPYQGGTTTVYSQYSGVNGWTTYNSVTIPSTGTYANLDLSSLPIFNYPRQNLGVDYCNNPIRFRIDQQSTDGTNLPPAIESIEIVADKERYQIDLRPDWKPAQSIVKVGVSIETGYFDNEAPAPDLWTNFLFNVSTGARSLNTGLAFLDETFNEYPIYVMGGSGQVEPGGRFGFCYRNYSVQSGSAVINTPAYDIFGLSTISNFYPDPLFEGTFRTVTNTEPRFVSGLTDGFLGAYTEIPLGYTGRHKIDYYKNLVYRPNNQASRNRLQLFNNTSQYPVQDFVQGVTVYPSSDQLHDGTAGIEAVVYSGIASGQLLISFDLEITQGSGIEVYLTGGVPGQSFIVPGDFARSYVPISLFTNSQNISELRIGFCVPSGYPGNQYSYNIDNIVVSPISSSYLLATGLTATTHLSGIPTDSLPESTYPCKRATTVFNTQLFLDSYPLSSSGILAKFVGEDGKGIEIDIESQGYLKVTLDQQNYSWSTGYEEYPLYEASAPVTVTSVDKVPVGQWSSIGVIHDVHSYEKFAYCSYSGNFFPQNFASTNKLIITIDGKPVANKDLMTGWKLHSSNSYGDSAPYISYIGLTGSVTATIASGLTCKIDGLSLSRPPVAESEAELSIKGARVSPPYFVPDCLYKANVPSGINNLLYNTGNDTTFGKDLFIGSCYNFSSPGHTNWDHGPIRNHLIYYGDVIKEDDNCPYSGYTLPSTRITDGSYAIAPYSSSFERLYCSTGQLDLYSTGAAYDLNSNKLTVFGWLYPRTTGSFLSIYRDKNYLTGDRLELVVSPDSKILFNKYNSSSNSVVLSNTGQTVELNEWTFINFGYDLLNAAMTGGATGVVNTYLSDSTGYLSSQYMKSGVDFGFRYLGREGTTGESQIQFGKTIDANFFNWVIALPTTNDVSRIYQGNIPFYTSGDKGGRYQTILDGSTVFTGTVTWNDFYQGYMTIPASNGENNRYISVAALNSYDQTPKLNGIVIHDNKPFREIESYSLRYNTKKIEQAFGATDSPIRIGNQVPATAINIARFSAPEMTVPASINTISLSDQNINNLITYKRGEYQINATLTENSLLTGYRNINTGLYAGRIDLVCSGQVLSSDVSITTLSVINSDYSEGNEGYYYYLIGRGDRGVKVLNAYSHYTGQISEFTTGHITDNYIANLEKVKNSIKLKNRKGEDLTSQIPFDIVLSPYTPDDLSNCAKSGISLYVDNIGVQNTGQLLPDGVFSTILITNQNRFNNDSLFVYYNSYDFVTKQESPGYKEIVNPQPIFRERHSIESIDIGKYDLYLNNNLYYDLKLYGIASGYLGQL